MSELESPTNPPQAHQRGEAMGAAWWTVVEWIDADDGSALRNADHHWLRPIMAARDELGRTPLMIAAWSGKMESFNALLEKGASLTDVDAEGVSAQDYAYRFGQGRRTGTIRMSVRLSMLERAVGAAREAEQSRLSALAKTGQASGQATAPLPRSRKPPVL